MKRLAILAAVSLFVACGGDDDAADSGPSCSDELKSFEACGGDVVGEWTIVKGCLDLAGEDPLSLADVPACKDVKIGSVSYSLSGSASFTAGGTYAESTSSSTSMHTSAGDACLQSVMQAPTMSGEALCGALNENSPVPMFDFDCSYGGGRCSCDMNLQGDGEGSSSGTYQVEGTNLIRGETSAFCVDGDRLVTSRSGEGGATELVIYERKK